MPATSSNPASRPTQTTTMHSNCTGHELTSSDVSGYSRPLPLVGLYTFLASSLCFLGLSLDLYRSLRRRKTWVASSLFPLNAATLAILAVATKPPSDISTAMPGVLDQLVKLTSIVLTFVVMAHFAPSLGLMSAAAKVSNLAGLAILVVTLAADVWIQISTGAIFPAFVASDLYSSVVMLIVFLFLVSHALTVTTTTRILEEQYDSMHRQILRELPADFSDRVFSSEKLVVCLNKYWLMALTSSPDFSARSSLMPVTMSILCTMTIPGIFSTAIIALSKDPCLLKSDYRWSIPLVFSAQAAGILVGTVVSYFRELNLGLRYDFVRPGDMLRVERHCVKMLEEWRESPLRLENRGRRARRIAGSLRRRILTTFLWLQIGIVLLAKFMEFIAIYASYLCSWIILIILKPIVCTPAMSTAGGDEAELNPYVLQLEGDEHMVPKENVVRKWSRYPARWVAVGRARHPQAHLLSFLKHHFPDVEGLAIPNISPEEFPTCWALPLATLATIAVVVRGEPADETVSAAREGIRYARLVDYSIEPSRLVMSKAADLIWEGVDLHRRWLDANLHELMGKGGEAVGKLRELSESRFAGEGFCEGRKARWSARAVAAHSMHEAARAILADIEMRQGSREEVVEWVDRALADVLWGCLRQLPLAIVEHCSMGRFGDREEQVREAALVLGEAEEVLTYLDILSG